MDTFTMGVTLADSLEGAPLFRRCKTYEFLDWKNCDRTFERAPSGSGFED